MGISRKSRNQMLKSFSELDFSPMFSTGTGPSLVTLTYPGRWKEVTPTGTTANRHLNLFFLRFERAWGVKPMAFWVREFTEKGAPHFHIYLALPGGLAGEPTKRAYEERLASWQAGECGTRPRWKQPAGFGLTFPEWASRVWAEIVDHPDPAERSKHEKYGVHVARLGSGSEGEPAWVRAYFSKKFSSPKGYQLKVPELWKESAESIGRSWSYRGLKRVGVTAEIPRRASIYIARLLHRKGRHVKVWDSELQKYTFKPSLQTWRRPRGPIIDYDTGPDGEQRPIRKKRKTTSRRRGMHGNGGAGYHLTHNGPRLADDIHHFLREITKPATPTDKLPPGLRGPVTQRRKTASSPRPAATARRELRDELSP